LFHAGNALGISLIRDFPSLLGFTAHHDEITLLTFYSRIFGAELLLHCEALFGKCRNRSLLCRLQGLAPTVNPFRR
jgi:hypothetical protein